MKRSKIFPLSLALCLFFAIQMFGSSSDLDPTFAVGSGASPNAVFIMPDGKLIVGGTFETVSGVRRPKLARLNPDGSFDATFRGTGVGGNGIVWAVAGQSDGKVVVGGEFQTINGEQRRYLARLNSDGSIDQGFIPQISDRVLSILIQPDGKIILRGDFQQVDGSFASPKLARLNPNGTRDTTFTNGLGQEAGNPFQILADGKILVGGGSNGISRLNSNGSVDAFNVGGAGLSGGPSAASTDSSGRLVVGGFITSYNGASRANLIRLFSNGTLDQAFNPTITGTIAAGSVGSVALQADGKILIAGFFDNVNGVARNGLARLNDDGTLDSSFNPTTPFPGAVRHINLRPDQTIVLGGQFSSIAGATRNGLAKLNPDGTIDRNFCPLRGPDDTVISLATLPSGKVLIGGFFAAVDEVPQNRIARLNPDSKLDTTFNVGSGFDGPVGKVAVQTDGRILVGGVFSSFNGVARRNIARLGPDGALDTSFDAGTAIDGAIIDIEIQSDGRIVVVGLFNSVNGLTGRHIARLNADGSIDQTFNVGSGADFEIYDVELRPNGQILVAGNFDTFNGSPRSSIARLNPNGSVDASFNASTQFDSAILSIATQPDGRIVVGGAFANVNGQQRNKIARLNGNGAVDASFAVLGGSSVGEIFKVALQNDGKILVGGNFLSLGSFGRPKIGRFLPSGEIDAAFNVGGVCCGNGNDAEVNDISIPPNGKILFAGEFKQVAGVEANRITRLLGESSGGAATFDYDADGRSDLSVWRPSDNFWYTQPSTGGFTGFQWGIAGDRITPADYDGDGKADIAVFRPSEGAWYVIMSQSQTFQAFSWGVNEDLPVPADHNGDGKADLVVYRTSNNTFYKTSTTASFFEGVPFGMAGDKPVIGDFDADGRADVAVYRASDRNWYVLRASGGFTAQQFGEAGDVPVPADYDGDGATDVAVYRPSTGVWYRWRSSGGGYDAVSWGIAGDIPVPADYDGDGRADSAVFRPSEGMWYLHRSTAGLIGIQFGQEGDLPTPGAFTY